MNSRLTTRDTTAEKPFKQRLSAGAAAVLRPASEPLLRQKYHELTLKHSKLLGSVFAEFTGLRFRVAWAPALSTTRDSDCEWANGLALCPLAGKRRNSGNGCGHCVTKHMIRALNAHGKGHRFTCHRGYLNYWLPICVRDAAVGIAHLQALDGKRSTRSARSAQGRGGAKAPNHLEFHRACRLLRLMVGYVETLDLAELRQADLNNARRTVIALTSQQARLRQLFKRVLPDAVGAKANAPRAETHGEQVLHCLLDSVHQHFMRPITLQECAANLGMNAAYLSDLFSRFVGLPFKTYLTEFRLQKAREMLCDSNRNISEVAYAVGYASENRFRAAFKKAVGLSPRQWRGEGERGQALRTKI